MKLLLASLFWLSTAHFVVASPEADNLSRVLRLSDVIAIMHDEGLDYANDLNSDMLAGQGGAFWNDSIKRLYDPDRIEATLRDSIAKEMDNSQIAQAVEFYETELGQRVLTLETSARAAMFDPDIEETARFNYHSLAASEDARLAAVTRFVEINDLLGLNVAGALTSNYQFYRGLVDGEAMSLSEDEIMSEVWQQEQEITDDTTGWLFGFLLMAYRPLSLDEVESYIAFSDSSAGRALNRALFDGFDIVYSAISYELGLSVAREMKSSDL